MSVDNISLSISDAEPEGRARQRLITCQTRVMVLRITSYRYSKKTRYRMTKDKCEGWSVISLGSQTRRLRFSFHGSHEKDPIFFFF